MFLYVWTRNKGVYETLVMVLGVAIIGGIVGIKYINSRLLDPAVVEARAKLTKQYVKELEIDNESYVKENKRLKGRINSTKGSVTFSPDVDLDSPDGIGLAVKELLPQIAPYLPKAAQGLLNDPKLLNIAIEFYKKDPEKAKQILSNFIKKGGKSKSTSSGQSGHENTDIPDFGESGVV